NLDKAAKKSENRLSSELEALITLPGVGKNTAHAIAAFAFHQPVPVLEANVKRVLARVFALKEPTEKQLWKYAEKLLDRKDPFTYNQAMMDIGSMVCTKAKPACSTCPLTEICQGKESPECYPQSKAKRKTPVRERDIVIFRGHRHPNNTPYYYLTPRTTRFLNGLYGFPEFEKGAEPVLQQVSYAKGDAIGTVRQVYSHFTLQAELFLVNVVMKNDTCWYTLDAIRTLPLSKADQKIVQFLE
ncbi:MAG: NUDIX domain-containing protein, partial [Rickettsiales bacterium]|nr:NUDIX domain-containing protein [Rickettsiales bacterium]